jgi:cobalt-zinc-cadmium efflux system membrane fusion protein
MKEETKEAYAAPEQRDGNGNKLDPGAPDRAPLARQVSATVIVLAILALAAFLLSRQARSEQTPQSEPTNPNVVASNEEGKSAADIRIGVAVRQSLDTAIRTTGLISYPTDSSVKIAPRVTGRVRQVFVKLGDRVRAGQPLAILESSDAATAQATYRTSRAALRQAQLDLERFRRLQWLGTPDVTAAQAAYKEAVASTKAAKTVLDLSKNQEKIGGFTQKPLEDATNGLIAAQSTLVQARADFVLAQKDYTRKKQLLAIGVAAKMDVEQSQDTFDKAQSQVAAAEGSVKLAQQAVAREEKAFGSNLYADQAVKQNEAAYVQALLQEQSAQKALQLAKAQILRDLSAAETAYTTAVVNAQNAAEALALLGNPSADGSLAVTSPVSGVVTERDVSPGQVVDQSTETPWQMFVVSNPGAVWVDADVHEADIGAVRAGARVSIGVAASPGSRFSGSVFSIAPTMDKTSHTVKVRSVIPNPTGLLRDGMYADVSIDVRSARSGIVVPMSAVSHTEDGDYVYVPSGLQFHRRLVTLGPARGDRVVVTSGISAGERIVTHGALYLGAQIADD